MITLTEDAIRRAIDNDARVGYELGVLVGLACARDGEIPLPTAADALIVALASELTESGIDHHDRRMRYISDRLAESFDLDFILEPVRSPNSFTGETIRENIAAQLLVTVQQADILVYHEWWLHEHELVRDAAVQAKIDQARGK